MVNRISSSRLVSVTLLPSTVVMKKWFRDSSLMVSTVARVTLRSKALSASTVSSSRPSRLPNSTCGKARTHNELREAACGNRLHRLNAREPSTPLP
eukprot:scaffold1522_cov340-Prasinococcus_capsulatus_cf.AAC.18